MEQPFWSSFYKLKSPFLEITGSLAITVNLTRKLPFSSNYFAPDLACVIDKSLNYHSQKPSFPPSFIRGIQLFCNKTRSTIIIDTTWYRTLSNLTFGTDLNLSTRRHPLPKNFATVQFLSLSNVRYQAENYVLINYQLLSLPPTSRTDTFVWICEPCTFRHLCTTLLLWSYFM